MIEEKDGLVIHSQKLAEEGSYAKELAAAAAVELRNLAEEVTKLSYQNAKLTADLAAAKEACSKSNYSQRPSSFDSKRNGSIGARPDSRLRKHEDGVLVEELGQELNAMYQREASLVSALSVRDEKEGELRKRLDEAKRHEEDLENELANMWVLVAKLRKSNSYSEEALYDGVHASKVLPTRVGNGPLSKDLSEKRHDEDEMCERVDEATKFEEKLEARYNKERRRCEELDSYISRLRVCPFKTNFSLQLVHNFATFLSK